MHQIKTDTLFNYETVKIFTSERFESNRLLNSMRSYQKGAFAVYSAWNSLSLIQDGISSLGLLACSFVLAGRVISGEMDIGSYGQSSRCRLEGCVHAANTRVVLQSRSCPT